MPKRNSCLALVLIMAFSAVLAGCAPECMGPELDTKGEPGQCLDSPFLRVAPNPFCNGTYIVYSTPVKAKILLSISDENEEILETLVDEENNAGLYRVHFQTEDMEAGNYFATLSVNPAPEPIVSGCGEVSAKLVLVR